MRAASGPVAGLSTRAYCRGHRDLSCVGGRVGVVLGAQCLRALDVLGDLLRSVVRAPLKDKADRRFDAKGLAVLCRVFARDAALKVADEGVRLVIGAADAPSSGGTVDPAVLVASMPLDAVRACQSGLIADMDAVADLLYGR